MYLLKNSSLQVYILDPIADQSLLGWRFCSGGYVYQVEDVQHGPLLSGPEFPAKKPAVTNGQGLPEVFQFTLYQDEREIEQKKLIIGVGLVDKRDAALPYHLFTNAQVLSFCNWEVAQSDKHLRFETTQSFKRWSFQLTREVTLHERSIRSCTRLQNIGDMPVAFRWFSHPFFPLTYDHRCCRLAGLSSLPKNPGFTLDDTGVIAMNAEHRWQKGCYLKFALLNGMHLEAWQRHDALGEIYATCDFPLSDLAIWANDKTFSFEPFYQATVLPQHEKAWAIHYYF
jgi:hypothetical protein